MASVIIAQVSCDSTIAVQVVKDFLTRRNVDISAISTAAQARTAMEVELRAMIKQVVLEQRMDTDGTAARATSQTTNNAAVILT